MNRDLSINDLIEIVNKTYWQSSEYPCYMIKGAKEQIVDLLEQEAKEVEAGKSI